MAKDEHLRILEEGVEAWNAWREEHPEVREPDLEGAILLRAELQRANLAAADLRKANLVNAILRKANLSGANLKGSALSIADLERARLTEADLLGADFAGAELKGSDLSMAKARGAKLWHTNLRKVTFWRTELEGANLSWANLSQVDLRDVSSLDGVYLYGATLDRTLLPREKLGGAVGEERHGDWQEAKEAYLALKNNWEQLGRYEDANWAYTRERRMEKRAALKDAKEAFGERNWCKAIRKGGKVFTDQFVEWLCDYGENLKWVLRAMLIVWGCFALLYGLVGGVWEPWRETAAGRMRSSTWNPLQLLAFSLGAMTTSDVVGLEVRRCVAMQVLVPLQAMVGIALTGLLGFVAGNRIRRS